MMKANAKYAEALTFINSALRDPVEAKNDHTLLVVLLLRMYEEVSLITWILDGKSNVRQDKFYGKFS
jgi:hypothetical protein